MKRSTNDQGGLPIELMAALDMIARNAGANTGLIHGRIIGQSALVAELLRYAPVDASHTLLISIGAQGSEIETAVKERRVESVLTLVCGPLLSLLRPLVSKSAFRSSIRTDLSPGEWSRLGYRHVGTTGIQGIGSLAMAMAERMFRSVNRPDLADRCRIGMLRTLVALKPLSLSTVQIRRYERVIS